MPMYALHAQLARELKNESNRLLENTTNTIWRAVRGTAIPLLDS